MLRKRQSILPSISVLLWATVFLTPPPIIHALDNGLALTPPMGFNNWQRFRCNIDCENYPDSCISEKLFMSTADAMVSRGYLDAGYQYVNIDDCWFSDSRNHDSGRLEPNPQRFPSGMKALADYVHSKGLKFGVYQDVGDKTCAGYPGLKGYEKVDAQTYAEWGVDYVKVDGCNIDPKEFDTQYPLFGKALNDSGRPIVYSCEWPWYQISQHITTNFTAVRETCNVWRNYDDIEDSFESLKHTMDYMGANIDLLRRYSGPGGWNDPDMLVIGDYGLSVQQAQAQFALWAMLASPLLISADIRNLRPEFEQILLNRDIIAVNQDKLGLMAERIDDGSKNGGVEIWRRPITPINIPAESATIYSYALAFWCRGLNGYPIMIKKTLAELGLNDANGYTIKNLYGNATDDSKDVFVPNDELQLFIEPSGGIIMLRATIATPGDRFLSTSNSFGSKLPYHDATQILAKQAWEAWQRKSAEQEQNEPQELTDDDIDELPIVYPPQQFNPKLYLRSGLTGMARNIPRAAVRPFENNPPSKWYDFRRHRIDLSLMIYVLACTSVVSLCVVVFALVRLCNIVTPLPSTAIDKQKIQKALRINSALKKSEQTGAAPPHNLSAQIDARRKHADDVFLPQTRDDDYDDGFDEDGSIQNDSDRHIGTVESGQYVRL